MAATYLDPDIPVSRPLAERRRLDACLAGLQDRGWQHLAPLAQHMANARLVRARGDTGAPLRHLDLEVLRDALSRLLRHQWENGYLVYQLVLEGAEPAHVLTRPRSTPCGAQWSSKPMASANLPTVRWSPTLTFVCSRRKAFNYALTVTITTAR